MPLPRLVPPDYDGPEKSEDKPKQSSKAAKVCYLISALLALITVIGSTVVLILSWYEFEDDDDHFEGLFEETQGAVWGRNNTCLTEVEGMKYVGWVVWVVQLVWLVYALSLVCRGSREKGHLYEEPQLFPASIPVIVMFGAVLHVVWVLLLGRGDLAAFGAIALIVASGLFHTALIISVYKLYGHERRAVDLGFRSEGWIIRIIVHNCIGGLASYTMVLVFLNMALLTSTRSALTNQQSCYLNLGLMFGYVVIFYAADLAALRHMRFTFLSPYIIMFAMVCSIIYKHRNSRASPENINLMVAGALGGILVLFVLFKLIIYVARFGCRAPPLLAETKGEPIPNSWEELSYRTADGSIRPDSLYRGNNTVEGTDKEEEGDIFKTPIYSGKNKRPKSKNLLTKSQPLDKLSSPIVQNTTQSAPELDKASQRMSGESRLMDVMEEEF